MMRKRWTALAGCLVAAAIVVAVPALWLRARPGSEASNPFHYRFERAARGSVTKALEQEIAFYQERLRRDPAGGLDLAALAGTYLKMARATGDLSWYLLAEQAARRSLASLPYSNEGAVLALARIAEARHDFAEAVRLAKSAGGPEALAIQVTSYLAIGRVDAARQASQTLLEGAPGLGAYTLRALVHIAMGEDQAALAAFEHAVEAEEPGEAGASALARAYLGRLHARRGRLTLARDLYVEALRILPQHPPALIYLAELQARAGEYDAAERHLSRVVSITDASPNVFDHVVLRGLARLRLLRGDRAGAEDIWTRAEARLRRDVTDGTFGHRRELARLLLERGRPEDLGEALDLLRADLRVRRDAETLDLWAWGLTRAGRWSQARDAMREALRWGLRDAGVFFRAGTIARALGDEAEAQRFSEAWRRTDPLFDAHARRVLGAGEE